MRVTMGSALGSSIESTEITDGEIVNADISPTAGINASKINVNEINHNSLLNYEADRHKLETSINHNNLLNYESNRHLLPTSINHNSLLNYEAERHYKDGSEYTSPICILKKATTQSITTATNTPVQFGSSDTEITDSLGMHSPTTNNTRITVPYNGYYLVFAQVEFASGNNDRYLNFRINGSGYDSFEAQILSLSATKSRLNICGVMYLSANDYVEMMVYHSHGSNLNIENSDVGNTFGLIRLCETARAS